MQLPQTMQCGSCQYSVNHPVDVCPVCHEQFYWLVVPKYSLSEAEVRDYCARMAQLTDGNITEEFLTHGGHLWLPHNFWECDANGVSLKTLGWVVEVKYFQHGASSNTAKAEPEPAVWDTQPAQASPFYEDGEEGGLVVNDLDDTLSESGTYDSYDLDSTASDDAVDQEDDTASDDQLFDPRGTVPSPVRLAHERPDPSDTVPAGMKVPAFDASSEQNRTRRPALGSFETQQPSERRPITPARRGNRHGDGAPSDRSTAGRSTAGRSTAGRSTANSGEAQAIKKPIAPVALFLFFVFLALGYMVLRYHKNEQARPPAVQTKVESDESAAILP